MFTGIVEETGLVSGITRKKNLSTLKVRAKKIVKGAHKGASIAVNGVCLTVTDVKGSVLCFDIMRETLLKTNLGSVKVRTPVNLERALKASGRIDGHFVTGHVDDMGVVEGKITDANYTELRIRANKRLLKYITEKGSVSLDGVSLTVGEVKSAYFSVYLIPFTLNATTLGSLKKGDKVNVETDILAKYILKNTH